MKRLICLLMVGIMIFSLCACETSELANSHDSAEPMDSEQSEQSEQIFYEDDILKATFVSIVEQDVLPGNAYIQVQFENKSEQEISILPMESSVNDTMVQFYSGMLATMQAEKKLNYAWFFPLESAGLSSIEEIEKIELSLSVDDADMHEIVKTDVLTIDIAAVN